jgi:hypothetical protein
MASAISNKLVDRYMASEDDFATATQMAQLNPVEVTAQRREPDMGLMSLSSAMQERPEFAYPPLEEVAVNAQRRQPDMSLLSPVEVMAQRRQPDMSLLSPVEVMAQRKDLPDQSSEGLASLGAMTGILPPEYDQQVAERRAGFAEFFDSLSDQFAENRARDREFLNRRSAPTSAPESKAANVQGDSPIQAQAVSGRGGDPILENILNRELVDPYMPSRVLGDEPIKPELAQEEAPDPIRTALDALTGAPGPDASNLKRKPSLDFADLIAESKRAGMANALMQLGAGIAGGDLSKGISAAGIAATKGQQDAKAIAIRKRLAEYQAGREDMARDEEKRQFGLELDLKQDQYGKSLLQTSLSSIPDMIRQRELELTSLRTTLSDDDPRITAIVEEIKNLTNQYYTFIKRAEGEINDFSGYRVVSTSGA